MTMELIITPKGIFEPNDSIVYEGICILENIVEQRKNLLNKANEAQKEEIKDEIATLTVAINTSKKYLDEQKYRIAKILNRVVM